MSDTNKVQTGTNTAINILTEAKNKIVSDLAGEDVSHIRIQATAGLDTLINRFAGAAGTLDNIAGTGTRGAQTKFPPVTDFMGEKIELPKAVSREELQPEEEELATLRSRVNKLYSDLPTLSLEGVLNDYTKTEDQQVLRGVAKKAGLTDYKDAAINGDYLEKIVTGIKSNEATAGKTKNLNDKLKDGENKGGK